MKQKTYISRHETKKASDTHKFKIKTRGGKVLKIASFGKEGVEFEYYFPQKKKNVGGKTGPKAGVKKGRDSMDKKLNRIIVIDRTDETYSLFNKHQEYSGRNYVYSRYNFSTAAEALKWIGKNIDLDEYYAVIFKYAGRSTGTPDFMPYESRKPPSRISKNRKS